MKPHRHRLRDATALNRGEVGIAAEPYAMPRAPHAGLAGEARLGGSANNIERSNPS